MKSAAAKENGYGTLPEVRAGVRGVLCGSGRRMVLPGSQVCYVPACVWG